MQITVPNEFQSVGKYNIGCTAGIESTICPPEWIEGINRMDLTLTSSKHSKSVFENSKFEKRDQNTSQIQEVIELKKPVEVLFEGINTNWNKFKAAEKIGKAIEDANCGYWIRSGEIQNMIELIE